MQCPYCVSEINDAALACPHCAHDLYLFKPLLQKIGELEQKLAAQSDYEELLERIEALEAHPQFAAPPLSPLQHGLSWLACWLTPLLLLLAAHALIVVVYDLKEVYLRIVSLLIPLPFGFWLARRHTRQFGIGLFAAFVMAALAVLGMSWITGLVDHTPVLPQDMREWREFIEYAASVGFSYATGMLVARTLAARKQRSRDSLALKLAEAAFKGQHNVEKVHTLANKLNDFSGSITAAATTAASIYTGLKGFLGN